MSMKNSMSPSGIEPANFRFVEQHFNHCATAVPPEIHEGWIKLKKKGIWFYVFKSRAVHPGIFD